MRCSGRAFTLAEMLVVVAIIGLIVSIMMPTFMSVTDLARETTCKNSMGLLSKAAFGYMGANSDVLPKNDIDIVTYKNFDPNVMLPGVKSTLKWWCNKVYSYGSRLPSMYICPADTGRAGDTEDVKCGYGFNNTLTNPAGGTGSGTGAGGLGYKTLYEITDPERTAMIGHCSDFSREPAIIEGMISIGTPVAPTGWPIGHMKRYDTKADMNVGRCGFVMGNGFVKTRTYSEVLKLLNKDGKLVLFRGGQITN